MSVIYSKPSVDIRKESVREKKIDGIIFSKQQKAARALLGCKDRIRCILCGNALKGEEFSHRGLSFVRCGSCGHIQTKAMPPDGYPWIRFKKLYPPLGRSEYLSRKNRIYAPKLKWIISCLKKMGCSDKTIKNSSWTELGCGGGYFLACLRDWGVRDFVGFDSDIDMVKRANSFAGEDKARHYNGKIEAIFDMRPSKIFVSFFVLEHVGNARDVFLKMRSLPKGTVFVFAVPVFGFSGILDGIFKENYARSLDCVAHTQIYTDRSIRYALDRAGFEIASEWIFGEDSVDFTRFILNNLSGGYSGRMLARIERDLLRLQDDFQGMLDRARMSDQRHILAVKT